VIKSINNLYIFSLNRFNVYIILTLFIDSHTQIDKNESEHEQVTHLFHKDLPITNNLV
jgi:hypothetical protein